MRIILNPSWSKEDMEKFNQKLSDSGGYCPCRLQHTPDTKCMCEEFRDKIDNPKWFGECHCGKFVKENN